MNNGVVLLFTTYLYYLMFFKVCICKALYKFYIDIIIIIIIVVVFVLHGPMVLFPNEK